MKQLHLILSLIFVFVCGLKAKADDYKFELKGVQASLISEVSSITPGQKFTVAIQLQHFDGFHTYWKNPGLVGYATSVAWKLPNGFKAGNIIWQVPERSKMLKYNCHAYKGDTFLLAEIQAPEFIPDKFNIAAKVGGMSCSQKECCKIGFLDIGIELNKSEKSIENTGSKKKIDEARSKVPKVIPGISCSVLNTGDYLRVEVSGKSLNVGLDEDIYFYAEQNITDTETGQTIIQKNDKSFVLTVKLNKFTSKGVKKLKGLLYRKIGWNPQKDQYLPIDAEITYQ